MLLGSTRKRNGQRVIEVPGPEHVCPRCGCNLQAWPYALAMEQIRQREKHFKLLRAHRDEKDRVWEIYYWAEHELFERWVALGRLHARCA